MKRDPTPHPATSSSAAERRRHARLKQTALLSDIGPVIDLSRSGMRIMTTRRRRGDLDVMLFDRTGRRIQVRARVIWSKRLSFRKHMVGLELLDPPESVLRELSRICTAGFSDV